MLDATDKDTSPIVEQWTQERWNDREIVGWRSSIIAWDLARISILFSEIKSRDHVKIFDRIIEMVDIRRFV